MSPDEEPEVLVVINLSVSQTRLDSAVRVGAGVSRHTELRFSNGLTKPLTVQGSVCSVHRIFCRRCPSNNKIERTRTRCIFKYVIFTFFRATTVALTAPSTACTTFRSVFEIFGIRMVVRASLDSLTLSSACIYLNGGMYHSTSNIRSMRKDREKYVYEIVQFCC